MLKRKILRKKFIVLVFKLKISCNRTANIWPFKSLHSWLFDNTLGIFIDKTDPIITYSLYQRAKAENGKNGPNKFQKSNFKL